MLHCTIYFSPHFLLSSPFPAETRSRRTFPDFPQRRKQFVSILATPKQRNQFVSIFQGLAGRFQQEEQEEPEKENP
jgi:hypothetical protein